MLNTADIDKTGTLFSNLLFFAMHGPNSRANSDFKYVSADWVGLPGWFFWPKNRSGVFLLKMQTDIFRLFYYPSIDEPLFDNFSCAEQLLRASDNFSRTGVDFSTECPHCECSEASFKDLAGGKGIPTPESRHRMSQELFVVGEIKLAWQKDDLIQIEVKSPLRDQTWAKNAVDIETDTGPLRLLEPDALDRDLPCWELASAFAESLVHFLPVSIIQESTIVSSETECTVSYEVRQNLCRTTGRIAE